MISCIQIFNPNSCQQPQSADNTKPREPGSQSPTEINAKQKETQGIAIETHHTEMSAKESEMPHGVRSSQSKRSDKKTVDIRENIPNDTQDKTEEDTEVSRLMFYFNVETPWNYPIISASTGREHGAYGRRSLLIFKIFPG